MQLISNQQWQSSESLRSQAMQALGYKDHIHSSSYSTCLFLPPLPFSPCSKHENEPVGIQVPKPDCCSAVSQLEAPYLAVLCATFSELSKTAAAKPDE